MEQFILDLAIKSPKLMLGLAILGSVLILAQVIVALSPSKKDDELLQKLESNSIIKKIMDILKSFSPLQKGANGLELSSKNVDK